MTPRQLIAMMTVIQLAQNEEEFSSLLEVVRGSNSVLEIGSRYGESLRRFSEVCKPNSLLVSVDLGGYPKDVEINKVVDPVESLKESGNLIAQKHTCHIIFGDSKESEVIEAVRKLGPYDFLFIDGDHSYEGVKADWNNYHEMAKIVAFHDIVGQPGCKQLWDEIKLPGFYVEYIAPQSLMGIGCLTQIR